jgi:hypothetical protein
MATCITELCNGGISSVYQSSLIAIYHFKALVLYYNINSVDRVKLNSFSHKQMICSTGSNFPTLQKIHSERLGVNQNCCKEAGNRTWASNVLEELIQPLMFVEHWIWAEGAGAQEQQGKDVPQRWRPSRSQLSKRGTASLRKNQQAQLLAQGGSSLWSEE